MARNAQWKGAGQVLSDLGTRNMQLLLAEPPKQLNSNGWKNLKRRFMRQFRPHNVQVVEAIKKRVADSRALLDTFSWPERRLLLSLLVPSDLDLYPSEEAHWNTCKQATVRRAFLDRFEGVDGKALRRFLNVENVVPGGMTTVEAKAADLQSSIDDEIASLKAKQLELRRCQRKCKGLQSSMKMAHELPALRITKSIETMLGKKATEHYHDGHSTYAEPTTMCIKSIAEALPSLGPNDIIVDLGSGAATTLWHLCQHHGCKGIGIEYAAHRLQLAANYTVRLIRDNANHPTFNPNVINTHRNIMTLSKLPPCTVLYLFDEAFPENLMEKIFELINDAPKTLKYILSSKGGRHAGWKDRLTEACRGVSRESEPIKIRKIGSGEGSVFQMFLRNVTDPNSASADVGCSIYTQYFESSIDEKMEYYRSLADKMAAEAETSKASRKLRTAQ